MPCSFTGVCVQSCLQIMEVSDRKLGGVACSLLPQITNCLKGEQTLTKWLRSTGGIRENHLHY